MKAVNSFDKICICHYWLNNYTFTIFRQSNKLWRFTDRNDSCHRYKYWLNEISGNSEIPNIPCWEKLCKAESILYCHAYIAIYMPDNKSLI